ncbi:MAG TPA: hypothetical protein VFP76_05240 [Gemmatimonadota bacterium]|nr:hypothetical protein [Gemmatimonadota bacterium]
MADRPHAAAALLAALLFAAPACDEDNPFRNISDVVSTGTSQVWEFSLPGFPSAFDFNSEQRFFVGEGGFASSLGNFLLDSRADGTLILRPFSSLVDFSAARTGIQDLGPVGFDAVLEVPESGYIAVDDSAGLPVVQGHVYAFRITRLQSGVVPINYAKLVVLETGTEFPDDPLSRFVRFQWSYQNQPQNRRLEDD